MDIHEVETARKIKRWLCQAVDCAGGRKEREAKRGSDYDDGDDDGDGDGDYIWW